MMKTPKKQNNNLTLGLAEPVPKRQSGQKGPSGFIFGGNPGCLLLYSGVSWQILLAVEM